MTEIEVIEGRIDKCARLLTDLSRGIVTSYMVAHAAQRRAGMSTLLTGLPSALSWSTAFLDVPSVDAETDGLIVRVDVRPSAELLRDQALANQSIAEQWEQIRLMNEAESADRKSIRDSQLAAELGAVADVVGRLSSMEPADLLAQPDFAASANEHLTVPLHELRSLVDGEATVDDLIAFYDSDTYRLLPFVQIESELMAQRVTGNERIRPSDVMDIRSIGAFLPYCTHMVLDRSQIEAVTSSGLDKRFDTHVLRLLDLDLDRLA